jgi:hypothetical protein
MATNDNSDGISLLIVGNPTAAAGMQPLVMVGHYPKDEVDRLKVQPVITEPLVYTIRHAANYLCYSLCDENVRPYGSVRDGKLIISIVLPKGKRLSGNLSPYTLLKEVYHTFVAINMYPSSDATHIFKEGDYGSDIFKGLLSKYRLVSDCTPYVPMCFAGEKGIICVESEEKLSVLMLDSQYPEFSKFSMVEIGRHCASTVKIEIPRPVCYPVVLNGNPLKLALSKDSDKFDSAKYLRPEKYTKYRHVVFTLHDLLQAPDNKICDGNVCLKDGKIYCVVESAPQQFILKASLRIDDNFNQNEKELILKSLKDGSLCVLFGRDDISKAFADDMPITILGKLMEQPVRIRNQYPYFTFRVERRMDAIILFVSKAKNQQQVLPKSKASSSKPQPTAPISGEGSSNNTKEHYNGGNKSALFTGFIAGLAGLVVGLVFGWFLYANLNEANMDITITDSLRYDNERLKEEISVLRVERDAAVRDIDVNIKREKAERSEKLVPQQK